MASHDRENDDPFDRIVHEYYRKVESGESASPEEFIRRHPEFEPQLRSFFTDLRALDDLPELGASRPTAKKSTTFDGRSQAAHLSYGDQVTYIGQYRLLGEIARGGMGIVFKATQEKLGRVVALKMILSGPLASHVEIDRFRREARAAARLQHPNIVPVHEIGQHDGHYFFTMDYIESESLAGRLREGSLSAEHSARLVAIIARAMHYAHGKGILHRDLKPANILIDTSGQPHITDFGLAKAQADADQETIQESTRTGQIIGTPSYMSPEQAGGKSELVDVRSDVYSLGAILYACLVGRAPFVGESSFETLQQVIEEDPPRLSVLNARVPIDIETICLKCLSKEPHLRYGTCEQLAEDLQRFLEGRPVLARPTSGVSKAYRWARRNPWIATTAALFILISIASPLLAFRETKLRLAAVESAQDAAEEGERAKRSEALAKQNKSEAEQNLVLANRNAEAERLAKEAANEALARNQYFLALAHWENGRVADAVKTLEQIPQSERHLEWQIANREFEGSAATLTGHVGPATTVVFSPDGRSIATGGEGEIRIWDAVAAELVRTIELDSAVNCLRYSSDAAELYSCSGNVLQTWNPETGDELGSLSTENEDDVIGSFDFHPREPIIALATRVVNEPGRLEWRSWPDGSKIRSVETPPHGTSQLHFSPDGRFVATIGVFSGLSVWDSDSREEVWKRYRRGAAAHFSSDASSLAVTEIFMGWSIHDPASGDVIQKGHRANSRKLRSARCLKFNPTGTRLAIGYSDGEIEIIAVQSERINRYRGHRSGVNDIEFSPDGSTLASVCDDGTVKLWDLNESKVFGAGNEIKKANSLITSHLEAAMIDRNRLAMSPWETQVDMAIGKLGKRLAICGFAKDVEIRDPTSLDLIDTLSDHSDFVTRIAISADETQLAAACLDTSIRVWDLDSGNATSIQRTHRDLITDLKFSPDGRTLFASSLDGSITFWDTADGRLIQTFYGNRNQAHALATNDDGDLLVSVGFDGVANIWNVESRSRVRTIDVHGSLSDVTFLPRSNQICIGGSHSDKSALLEIWDAQTGKRINRFEAGSKRVIRVAVNSDASRLLTCDDQGVAKLWDAEKQQELLSYDELNFTSEILFCPNHPTFFRFRTLSSPGSGPFDLPILSAELTSIRGASPSGFEFNRRSQNDQSRLLRSAISRGTNLDRAMHSLAKWLANADPAERNFKAALAMFHRTIKMWKTKNLDAADELETIDREKQLPTQVREVLKKYSTPPDKSDLPKRTDPSFQSELVRWYDIENRLEAADEHAKSQRFPKAIGMLEELIEEAKQYSTDPRKIIAHVPYAVSSVGLHRRLANYQSMAGQSEAKQTTLLKLAQWLNESLDPKNPADWSILADLWFDLSRRNEAAAAYETSLLLSGQSKVVPEMNQFSDYLPPNTFRLLDRLMLARQFKPAAIEGKRSGTVTKYRARYENWDGPFYYRWGTGDIGIRQQDETAREAGMKRVWYSPFEIENGQMRYCAIWEVPRPGIENGSIEGEAFFRIAHTGGEVATQEMTQFKAAKWSGDEHLLWIHGTPENQLTLGFKAKTTGRYCVSAVLTTAIDFGTVDVYLDDGLVAPSIDLYRPGNPASVNQCTVSLGTHRLEKGKHQLRFVLRDHHEDSIPRNGIGLDYVRFDPAE